MDESYVERYGRSIMKALVEQHASGKVYCQLRPTNIICDKESLSLKQVD